MAHPTINPQRTVIDGTSLVDGTVAGKALASDSIGLTQTADVIQKNIIVVPLGNTLATATNTMLFRAPASGAKLTAIYISPGSNQNHDGGESDTWIFQAARFSATVKKFVSLNAPSLSNQTLAATAYKSLVLNGGACTLVSGDRLRLEASISGTPDALQWPVVQIEYLPYTSA